MPTPLAAVYSLLDSLKRRAGDAVSNPLLAIQQLAGRAEDDAGAHLQDLQAATAEGMKYGPATEKVAMALADAYNPAGVTVFHGSPTKFTRFEHKSKTGVGDEWYGPGTYTTSVPQQADAFADSYGAKGGYRYHADLPDELLTKLLDVRTPIRELPPEQQTQWIAATKLLSRKGKAAGATATSEHADVLNQMRSPGVMPESVIRHASDEAKQEIVAALQKANVPGFLYPAEAEYTHVLAGEPFPNFTLFPGNESQLKIQRRVRLK